MMRTRVGRWLLVGVLVGAVVFHGAGAPSVSAAPPVINVFNLPNTFSLPAFIVAGPDGNLWFTEEFGNRIGRITTAGMITEFPIPTANSFPFGIAAGSDGNLWFVEDLGYKIGRITPAGIITEFSTGITANSQPFAIAAGPDGNLWASNSGGSSAVTLVTITVVVAPLTQIAVTPVLPTLKVGQGQRFIATGIYVDNTTANLSNQVTWTSDVPTIASVDASGMVTPNAPGTAHITATQGNVTGQTSVTVTASTPVGVAPAPQPANRPIGTTSEPSAAPAPAPGGTARGGTTGGPSPVPAPPGR